MVALVDVCAVTDSDWLAGTAPPTSAVKVSVVGSSVIPTEVAAVTVRLTLKVSEPALESTESVLLYVPGASPVGTMEIVKIESVVGLLSEATTQVALSVCRVREIGVELKMLNFLAAGTVPPTW
jgi:hypothetical protein